MQHVAWNTTVSPPLKTKRDRIQTKGLAKTSKRTNWASGMGQHMCDNSSVLRKRLDPTSAHVKQ